MPAAPPDGARTAMKVARPPDAAVARFRADFARLTHGRPVRPLVLGVSGGPDSLALLLLAHAAAVAPVTVLTVDHGLRDGAADEARLVARLCSALNVDALTAAILPDDWARAGAVNRHATARRLRYRFLGEIADRIDGDIVTAHHADDQVETMVMRLNRGSGVGGVAGVRATHRRVLRPLLDWRRAELATICAHCGVAPVDDPSNHDARYDRVRLRAAMAGATWIDAVAWAKSAHALAEANDALDFVADALVRRNAVADGDGWIIANPDRALPRELLRRVALRALRLVDPAIEPRGAAIDRAVATLDAPSQMVVGNVLVTHRGEGDWRFAPAPPRRA